MRPIDGASNCLVRQADFSSPRHSVPSLIMALSMTNIFRSEIWGHSTYSEIWGH